MTKCPYCKEELKLKLEISPTPVDEKFKDDILIAFKSFIDIQADIAPFGGNMIKQMAKMSLKFVDRYFDKIGAIPIVFHSCINCDSLINSESLFDYMNLSRSK